MAGEPIELRLTANNVGTETATLVAEYPTFEGGDGTGLRFSLAEERRAAHPQPAQDPSIIPSHRVPLVPVAPGKTLSVSVFLQAFMPDLPPGIHEVKYSVRLACDGPRPEAATIEGQGVLSVVVLQTGENELATAIAELGSRLNTASGYWERRSVEEGLLVTNSPLVIPYLRKLMPASKSAVVKALAKFRGNPAAEEIVLGALRDGHTDDLAMSVLQGWKYPLGADDLAHVLARGDPPQKLAALRYAGSLNSKALIPAVSAYAEDSDPQVAAEARRATDALNKNSK